MREIKFRVWKNNEMSDAVDFQQLGKREIICDTKEALLLQYTGLKDKNDKEIYEGDIVEVESYGICRIVFILGSFMCEWDDDCYSIELSKIAYDNRQSDKNLFKIIGNIYENPELLQ